MHYFLHLLLPEDRFQAVPFHSIIYGQRNIWAMKFKPNPEFEILLYSYFFVYIV